MKNATLKELLIKIEEGIEYIMPKYESGYNGGMRDTYVCPCCGANEHVQYNKGISNNLKIDEMEHDSDCLYLSISELGNVLANDEILKETDTIIINEDLYEEQKMYGERN